MDDKPEQFERWQTAQAFDVRRSSAMDDKELVEGVRMAFDSYVRHERLSSEDADELAADISRIVRQHATLSLGADALKIIEDELARAWARGNAISDKSPALRNKDAKVDAQHAILFLVNRLAAARAVEPTAEQMRAELAAAHDTIGMWREEASYAYSAGFASATKLIADIVESDSASDPGKLAHKIRYKLRSVLRAAAQPLEDDIRDARRYRAIRVTGARLGPISDEWRKGDALDSAADMFAATGLGDPAPVDGWVRGTDL